MSRKPILITAQPSDKYFIWQNQLYIESCLEVGFDEENIHILVYDPPGRRVNVDEWSVLTKNYPKLKIFRYKDQGIAKFLSIYIPVIRPHILWQHFKLNPELEKETIIYTDADILWSKNLNISKFFDDDVCYMSDAHSYMNNDYFNRKYNDIKEDKKKDVKNRDFLKEACSIVGVDKSIIMENNFNTGGVQYILKNIDWRFWKKVEEDVLKIRLYLLNINKEFYENENKGIQSWCSDLWAVLWNLWYFKKETKVIPEMDFAWSSDKIEKLDKVGILHNAGLTSEKLGEIPVFYKGKYHAGLDPLKDPHLEKVYNNELSKTLCNWVYVKKLINLKNK